MGGIEPPSELYEGSAFTIKLHRRANLIYYTRKRTFSARKKRLDVIAPYLWEGDENDEKVPQWILQVDLFVQ